MNIFFHENLDLKWYFLKLLTKQKIGKWDMPHLDIQKRKSRQSIGNQIRQTWRQNLLYRLRRVAKLPMEEIPLVEAS